MADSENRALSEEELQELVAASDSGARAPIGWVGTMIAVVALIWSVFQVLLASPISNYVLSGDLINNARQIHLAFAIFLAAMAYPLFKSSPRDTIPWYDWILGLGGAFLAMYGYAFYDKIVGNGGLADTSDAYFALAGLVFLFIAAYRTLGPVMVGLAIVFLFYVFFGSSEVVPDQIRWAGASLRKAMSHMWITSEGVFGIALGVSTKFVFLFVLFGALLDKAGAGNYFIKMAFGALGHLRGGPAKAAVVGSAATGLISGSSIANVVTTGTFTIPLMKRVGFSAEKAGSVEVASSVNGQIMPPVMGAAAFLMVEYVGISYVEVITHAFLPAVISYIALVYIVHLEAVKNNMPTIGNKVVSMGKTIGGMFAFFAGFAGLCYLTQFPVRLIVAMVPAGSGWILAALLLAIYIALIYLAAQSDDLEPDDPNAEVVELPDVAKIYKSGLYYLLPIIVLVYFLMIERKSPGLSAFWATLLLFAILLTQKSLKAFFRGETNPLGRLRDGVTDWVEGMIDGARNMIGIGLATATAGIIVGTVSLTGIGQVMADFVEFLSGGNLILMLVFVAILSLILGMGLPTTANYIVVSSLMVGVVVELGAQSGLIVPLIAVHLFVFYFGIMADVTPPVGLASFAAAAVSGGDAIRTGFTAFFYSLRTVALPFVFIFNTDLLLIDVTWMQGIIVFIIATIGILVFTAGTMGFFLTRSRIWETVALLVVAFALFRPGFFMDQIQPPYETIEPAGFVQALEAAEPGSTLRTVISGPDFDTLAVKDLTVPLIVPDAEGADARLQALGLMLVPEGEVMRLDEPAFGTELSNQLGSFDFYGDDQVAITRVQAAADQLPKELIFIPALMLLALVAFLQTGRARKLEAQGVTA
ncbi:TRAP transporter, 4TM/12TM fusion protein [Aliiroseovarius crassostreae]|uniref:C4-dicarboxylate ABC transporter n=1 Tax=Aliiroseovarius crassostreae TaxID=154981 RepID=A0A0P7I1F8_9RHOB|nr:TRAP transporter permease [Aliiroseovarius crassostreae]KPN62718.1 C4-dicarboxylate ABC transporter [Aliiroseovarius crassostreae]SFU90571.1 TRAP transporter, 4TM/12TM fusion protein [Aliiroseovarius crassostreae]